MRRPFALLCLGLVSLTCGGRPSVQVNVDAPNPAEYDQLDRVRLVIRRCDDQLLTVAADVSSPAGGNDVSGVKGVADVPASTPFYVWIQGWRACEDADPCTPEQSAQVGDCICFVDRSPAKQRITLEGCSGWLVLESGEEHTVGITMGPVLGVCPPSVQTCPAVETD